MNKKTLIALKESIKHWKEVVKHPKKTKTGEEFCALCQLFIGDCIGCPVSEKTGRRYCEKTPYYTFCNNKTETNAQKELRFLKSLLPQGKKER